jgi:hypothetical protein
MMTENLLEASLVEAPRDAGSDPRAIAGERSLRPAGLPDKFWDEKTGQVRLDALVKSYLELERKLGALGSRDIPMGPEQYNINIASELLSADPEVNRRLHAAGFTQQQAQLVYDLAGDRLMPMIAELATMFEAESQIERLTQHFGGEERWREIARQINAWAGSHLPSRVFEALSTTFEGVVAMYRMMSGEEPGFLRQGEGSAGTPSEAEIKQLMRDPRYWRQQDPAVVEQVREGFRQLYKQRS